MTSLCLGKTPEDKAVSLSRRNITRRGRLRARLSGSPWTIKPEPVCKARGSASRGSEKNASVNQKALSCSVFYVTGGGGERATTKSRGLEGGNYSVPKWKARFSLLRRAVAGVTRPAANIR